MQLPASQGRGALAALCTSASTGGPCQATWICCTLRTPTSMQSKPPPRHCKLFLQHSLLQPACFSQFLYQCIRLIQSDKMPLHCCSEHRWRTHSSRLLKHDCVVLAAIRKCRCAQTICLQLSVGLFHPSTAPVCVDNSPASLECCPIVNTSWIFLPGQA